jgi:hypothetical protein
MEHEKKHSFKMPEANKCEESKRCPECGDRYGEAMLALHLRDDHFVYC